MKPKIVVGLSGGVDSAVSALLLKESGYEVHGVYMQNWEADRDDTFCSSEQDLTDAKAVCAHLKISFEVVNFAKHYWDRVFQCSLDELAAGRTPNPDIGCNREIKFKVFLEHALKLGADKIATGHYAQIEINPTQLLLKKAHDINKDQTYFLYTLGQQQLAKVIFPIGHLSKNEVRKIAKENGLINFAKKDSTGICFIGERKFTDFIREYLLPKPGDIETFDGKKIGEHQGLMYYTLGQRKGIKIGGLKGSKELPWYVLKKDQTRNVLIVGQDNNHPALFTKELFFEKSSWVEEKIPTLPLSCTAKIRYRQMDQPCTINLFNNDTYRVEFNEPQRAITPGQSVVFYNDNICLGGGIIK